MGLVASWICLSQVVQAAQKPSRPVLKNSNLASVSDPTVSKKWFGLPEILSFSFESFSDNMKEALVYGCIRCQGMLLLLHSVSFCWRALVSQRSSFYASPWRKQQVLDLNLKTCGILPHT